MYLDEVKTELAKSNVIIGSKQTIKLLKNNKVRLIVLAVNCPEDVKKDIKRYATMSKIEVKEYDGTAKQLGIFCGKPFPIATLSIKGESK